MAIHNTVLVDSGQVAANLFACASINGDAITTLETLLVQMQIQETQ